MSDSLLGDLLLWIGFLCVGFMLGVMYSAQRYESKAKPTVTVERVQGIEASVQENTASVKRIDGRLKAFEEQWCQ